MRGIEIIMICFAVLLSIYFVVRQAVKDELKETIIRMKTEGLLPNGKSLKNDDDL